MNLELDQFKDVYLVIDKANDSFVQKQFVSQGDYKGRSLTVQVTNNGNVGEVPGLTLNLNWHNEASGLTDLTAFTILNKENSIFRIEYPEHMMTPGKVYASIQVIQDGKVTNLRQFELIVQKLAGQPVGIVEKAEFSALVAALADSNKFRTDIDKKADKTYINDYLSQVTVVPETFTNLAAIKAKYPSGKNGLMVAADNGHKYIWTNSTWTDAGVYQAVGLAPSSVTTPILSNQAVNFEKIDPSTYADYHQVNFRSVGDQKIINLVYRLSNPTVTTPKSVKIGFSVVTQFNNIDYLRAQLNEKSGVSYPLEGVAAGGNTGTLTYLKGTTDNVGDLTDSTIMTRVGVVNQNAAMNYLSSEPNVYLDGVKQEVQLVGLMNFNGIDADVDKTKTGLLSTPKQVEEKLKNLKIASNQLDPYLVTKWDYFQHVEKATSVNNSAQLWLVGDIASIDLTGKEITHAMDVYSKSGNFKGLSSAIFVSSSKDGIIAGGSGNLTYTPEYDVSEGHQTWRKVLTNDGTLHNNKFIHVLLRANLKDINTVTDIYFKDVSLSIGGKAVTLSYNGVFGIGGDYPVQEVYTDYYDEDSFVTNGELKRFKKNTGKNIFFKVNVNQDFPQGGSSTEIQDSELLAPVDCVLRLPSTYTETGEPTKLAMWAHGAGGRVTETSAGELDAAAAHLLSAGYALFDANGSNNDYLEHADHMSSPRAISAYKKAYDYIVQNYNVDPLIYVHGHSMGGLLALNFANKFSGIVRCLALAHPVVDLKGQAWDHPWFGTTRKQLAVEHNFNDKTGATFEADKLTGYNPINTMALLSGDKRLIFNKLPIKIWHGTADTTVDISGSINYINGVKAAGGQAELRTVEGIAHIITASMFEEIKFFFNRY